MCHLFSYKENLKTGEILFLTDKDLEEHNIAFEDGIGHHAIHKVYPYHPLWGYWTDKECSPANSKPVPATILKAWRDGKMKLMARYMGYITLKFNDAGFLHCEDGPAMEKDDGSKIWYKNGVYHNENGPAVIWGDGGVGYYIDGLPHREDGPAIIYPDGLNSWYKHGFFIKQSMEQMGFYYERLLKRI